MTCQHQRIVHTLGIVLNQTENKENYTLLKKHIPNTEITMLKPTQLSSF